MPTPMRPVPVTDRHVAAPGAHMAVHRRAASGGKVVAGIGLTAAALVGAVFANTDAVVSAGFTTAIERTAAGDGAKRLGSAGPAIAAVSGSEEYWLSRAVNGAIRPAAWQAGATQPGIVGQHFTLSANGVNRTLEIAEVRAIPASADAATPLVLVTCKDLADTAAAPVRLVLEPGQSLPGLPSLTAPRAL